MIYLSTSTLNLIIAREILHAPELYLIPIICNTQLFAALIILTLKSLFNIQNLLEMKYID